MTAADLVRYLTDALFIAVFAAALVRALRDRRRTSVDAALFFGALASILVQSEVTRSLGISLPPIVSDAAVSFLLAMPYLLLRMTDELVGVPRPVTRGALIGLGVIVVAMFALPQQLPQPFTLALVAYFGGLMIYAAVLLTRGGLRTSGVVRERTRAAALGSVLLGAAILAAGAQTFLSIFESVTRILALGSALAYFAAFATPSLLKQAWREPQLRGFLGQVASISPRSDVPTIAASIEAAAKRATGSTARVILDEADRLPVAMPVSSTLVAAPITARGRRFGTLALRLRREPLFPEDERALAGVLADQAGLVLDGARLYRDLEDTNRALERATQAKSEFLANMSHELRTPMNAILGFSDLLLEQLGPSLAPAQQRYFRNIKDAGSHLLELINEVLDLSKVEAGRLELRPEPIRVNALVDPVIDPMRRAAQAKGLGFVVDVADGPVVRVDPGRMRQILYNLLSNAVKFTNEGRIELHAAVEGQALRLDVVDTGIGIPADRRDRVFGTFERLHDATLDVAGTGLGLALTKRLVELHGGEISFESEQGSGTTFRVRIPDTLFAPVSGVRVLVVEDTERDAQLITAVAAQVGLPTEVVATASAGRDAARRDPPLGVVLDLRLPDERGEVLLAQLKEDPRTRDIPVLVVTVEDDEGRSRPLGAEDHLTKPIDRDRVAAWMGQIRDRRRAEETAPAD